MKQKLRIGLYALIGASFGIGLIGFAHTPAGRPLLQALRGAPGCPVSLDQADPAKVEAFRVAQLERRDGSSAAASHPALAWQLGQSRRSDVVTTLGGADCRSARDDSVLRCKNLPESGDDLHLQFDAQDRLVAVDLLRAPSDGPRALVVLERREQELQARVGEATSRSGQRNPAYLSSILRRTASEFRYHRYLATLSAMNYGKRGIRVREQYQWSPSS
jgi:hypothetical protein